MSYVTKSESCIIKPEFNAFTLAEVLITLGIIGVVAALTLPALLTNITCSRFKTQFRKTISIINQGVTTNKAINDYDFGSFAASGLTFGNPNHEGASNPDNRRAPGIFKATMKGRFYKDSTSPGGSEGELDLSMYSSSLMQYAASAMSVFQFVDGSEVAFSTCMHFDGGDRCRKENGVSMICLGWIDVNGHKNNPNKEVTCADGTVKKWGNADYVECTVPQDSEHMTDIYPVWFHDSTVEPYTNAARYVMYNAK